MSIIYMAQCLVNDKVYVGKTCKSMERRRQGHVADAVKGSNRQLARAIRKYGIKAFSWQVLSHGLTKFAANNFERIWIVLLCANHREFGYNSTFGGDGEGRIWSEESKRKLSATTKGVSNAGAFKKGEVPLVRFAKGHEPFNKGLNGWKHGGSFGLGHAPFCNHNGYWASSICGRCGKERQCA